MSEYYGEQLKHLSGIQRIEAKRAQREWLLKRSGCEQVPEHDVCLRDAYNSRINELATILAAAKPNDASANPAGDSQSPGREQQGAGAQSAKIESPPRIRSEYDSSPTASSAPPRPSVIMRADWLRQPSAEDMARYFPTQAQMAGIKGGRALLDCTVHVDSTASCVVASESPSGYGFGDAAMNLSRLFRFRPATRDGVPFESGDLKVPVGFRANN
jgi:hypothetical protein